MLRNLQELLGRRDKTTPGENQLHRSVTSVTGGRCVTRARRSRPGRACRARPHQVHQLRHPPGAGGLLWTAPERPTISWRPLVVTDAPEAALAPLVKEFSKLTFTIRNHILVVLAVGALGGDAAEPARGGMPAWDCP